MAMDSKDVSKMQYSMPNRDTSAFRDQASTNQATPCSFAPFENKIGGNVIGRDSAFNFAGKSTSD